MFIRLLPAAIIALSLTGSAHAATVTQVIDFDPISAGPAISDTEGSWVKKRGKVRRFFAGFDPSLGTITGARLDVQESWTLDTALTEAGGVAGTHKAKGRAVTRLQVGTKKSTFDGPFRHRLSVARTRNAVCETLSDTDTCAAARDMQVDTLQSFYFDADRAKDLFMDPGKMLIRWTVKSRLIGSGLAEASIFDGSIRATLHVDYAPPAAVPLPASGLVLMAGLASMAMLRRRRRTS